jgi:hypothetical protein
MPGVAHVVIGAGEAESTGAAVTVKEDAPEQAATAITEIKITKRRDSPGRTTR